MLDEARLVYEERLEEVERYCNFLQRLISGRPALLYRNANGESREEALDPGITHMLKANAFLLIYNLVEATVRQALQGIRDHINRNGHQFDELHEALRSHLTSMMRDDESRGQLASSPHPIGRALIYLGFNSGKLIGGNISHKSLKQIADRIGFSVETDAAKTKGGKSIGEVKMKRNQLAHGEIAFIECGRNTAIEDIVTIKAEVAYYLSGVLDNIECWLGDKGYLENSARKPG